MSKELEALEIIKGKINRLEEDLQYYTMINKDKALASHTERDLKKCYIIKKELEVLEELKTLVKIAGENRQEIISLSILRQAIKEVL